MTDTASMPVAPAWLERHRVSPTGVTLDQVLGLAAARREVAGLVARLRHPEIIRKAGGELPRGILFWGPAGCGKTLLARAMAGMLTTGEQPADFFAVAASDLGPARFEELSCWLQARGAGASVACIYIDEIDHFGRNRDHPGHNNGKTGATLLAAIAAMDGLATGPGSASVVWLASTNRRLAELEPSLVRAGRYGHHVAVRPPSRREAEEILAYYGRTRPVEPGLDWRRAAALARPGTSPAALRQALDDALSFAIADDGPDAVIRWSHVAEAILREGRIDSEPAWSDAKTRAVAVHEGGHVAARIEHGLPVRSVSLRTTGGITDGTPDHHDGPEDADDIRSLSARIVVAMAGAASEDVLLGTVSAGNGRDIAEATRQALAIVGTGSAGGAPPVTHGFFEDSAAAMDDQYQAVAALVAEGQRRAYALVARRHDEIAAFADLLAVARDLSGTQLADALAASGLASRDQLDSQEDTIDA